MRNIKSIIASLLVVIVLISGCACKDPVTEESEPQGPVFEMTEFKLLDEGKSDYRIVVSDTATENELYSANELQYFFHDATAVKLPIVTDNTVTYSNTAKYIVIGETDLNATAGLTVDKASLKTSGVDLQTIGGSVFLNGGTGDGIIYAAYEFLGQTLGFEAYAAEVWEFNPYNPNVFLPDFDATVIPSFDVRGTSFVELCSDAHYLKLMRASNFENSTDWMYVNNWCHTTQHIMPPSKYLAEHPDWYSSDGTQLCYNNEEMTEEFIKVYLDLISKNKTATKGIIGIYDNTLCCVCDKCKADPTMSTSYIKFGNKLAAAIKEAFPDRDFRPFMLVYEKYEEAPVTQLEDGSYVANSPDVIPADNLGILMTTYRAAYHYPLYHEENALHKKKMEAWSAITKDENLYQWHYCTNFNSCLALMNNFETLPEDYKFAADLGIDALFDQGARTYTSGFSELKVYIQTKLMWDASLNVETLINNFMRNYYGDAGEIMGAYLDEVRAHYEMLADEKGILTSIRDGEILSSSNWPYQTTKQLLSMFDDMFATIKKYETSDPEKYEKLYDRINKQTLMLRYTMLNYHTAEYTDAKLREERLAFRADAEKYSIQEIAEFYSITTIWETWGIS